MDNLPRTASSFPVYPIGTYTRLPPRPEPREVPEEEGEPLREICKTKLKTELGLTDGDIAKLHVVRTAPNPRFRSAAPMVLYSVGEAMALAIQKYGSIERRLAQKGEKSFRIKTQRANRLRERMETRVEEIEEESDEELPRIPVKREELVNALSLRGLSLRSDSRLCKQFMAGESAETAEEVATIMEEMDWYFSHTEYSSCRQEIIREELDYEGSFDSHDVSEHAKKRALKRWVLRNTGSDLSNVPVSLHSGIRFYWSRNTPRN